MERTYVRKQQRDQYRDGRLSHFDFRGDEQDDPELYDEWSPTRFLNAHASPSSEQSPSPYRESPASKRFRQKQKKTYMPEELAKATRAYFKQVDEEVLEEEDESDEEDDKEARKRQQAEEDALFRELARGPLEPSRWQNAADDPIEDGQFEAAPDARQRDKEHGGEAGRVTQQKRRKSKDSFSGAAMKAGSSRKTRLSRESSPEKVQADKGSPKVRENLRRVSPHLEAAEDTQYRQSPVDDQMTDEHVSEIEMESPGDRVYGEATEDSERLMEDEAGELEEMAAGLRGEESWENSKRHQHSQVRQSLAGIQESDVEGEDKNGFPIEEAGDLKGDDRLDAAIAQGKGSNPKKHQGSKAKGDKTGAKRMMTRSSGESAEHNCLAKDKSSDAVTNQDDGEEVPVRPSRLRGEGSWEKATKLPKSRGRQGFRGMQESDEETDQHKDQAAQDALDTATGQSPETANGERETGPASNPASSRRMATRHTSRKDVQKPVSKRTTESQGVLEIRGSDTYAELDALLEVAGEQGREGKGEDAENRERTGRPDAVEREQEKENEAVEGRSQAHGKRRKAAETLSAVQAARMATRQKRAAAIEASSSEDIGQESQGNEQGRSKTRKARRVGADGPGRDGQQPALLEHDAWKQQEELEQHGLGSGERMLQGVQKVKTSMGALSAIIEDEAAGGEEPKELQHIQEQEQPLESMARPGKARLRERNPNSSDRDDSGYEGGESTDPGSENNLARHSENGTAPGSGNEQSTSQSSDSSKPEALSSPSPKQTASQPPTRGKKVRIGAPAAGGQPNLRARMPAPTAVGTRHVSGDVPLERPIQPQRQPEGHQASTANLDSQEQIAPRNTRAGVHVGPASTGTDPSGLMRPPRAIPSKPPPIKQSVGVPAGALPTIFSPPASGSGTPRMPQSGSAGRDPISTPSIVQGRPSFSGLQGTDTEPLETPASMVLQAQTAPLSTGSARLGSAGASGGALSRQMSAAAKRYNWPHDAVGEWCTPLCRSDFKKLHWPSDARAGRHFELGSEVGHVVQGRLPLSPVEFGDGVVPKNGRIQALRRGSGLMPRRQSILPTADLLRRHDDPLVDLEAPEPVPGSDGPETSASEGESGQAGLRRSSRRAQTSIGEAAGARVLARSSRADVAATKRQPEVTGKENEGLGDQPEVAALEPEQKKKSSVGIFARDEVMGAPLADAAAEQAEPSDAAALRRLLCMCGQDEPCTLAEALSTFCDINRGLVKLGEGSYAEAYAPAPPEDLEEEEEETNLCFKIVPMDGRSLTTDEPQMPVHEVVTEMESHLAISQLHPAADAPGQDAQRARTEGFVLLHGARVCRGQYSKELLEAWGTWDELHRSENDPPNAFPDDQLYAVFAMERGGMDLEGYPVESLDEAKAILFQIIAALAAAEETLQFEHRDLHWGNILVGQTPEFTGSFRLKGQEHRFNTRGLKVSIIDFTLSRFFTGKRVCFSDLSTDPGLFKGRVGNPQADAYRKMKAITRGAWEKWCPRTNVVWARYVMDILEKEKTLRLVGSQEKEVKAFKKRLMAASMIQDVVFDEFFTDLIAT